MPEFTCEVCKCTQEIKSNYGNPICKECDQQYEYYEDIVISLSDGQQTLLHIAKNGGYRLLGRGEAYKVGDKYWNGSDAWITITDEDTGCVGQTSIPVIRRMEE